MRQSSYSAKDYLRKKKLMIHKPSETRKGYENTKEYGIYGLYDVVYLSLVSYFISFDLFITQFNFTI